jgi:hypothetical protein
MTEEQSKSFDLTKAKMLLESIINVIDVPELYWHGLCAEMDCSECALRLSNKYRGNGCPFAIICIASRSALDKIDEIERAIDSQRPNSIVINGVVYRRDS